MTFYRNRENKCSLFVAPTRRNLVNNSKTVTASSSLANSVSDVKVAVIIVAGGKGKRMKSKQPKQLLPLLGKRVIEYSLDLFTNLEEVKQITVVIDKAYRPLLRHFENRGTVVKFADPGAERHDSVMNGLATIDYNNFTLIAVHDAARPCLTVDAVRRVFNDGMKYGAAILATPVKPTIKYSEDGEFVSETLQRSKLWDVQTPQVATPAVLQKAYDYLKSMESHELPSVTDDSSLIEKLNLPVKVTIGEYTNIKITTMDDVGQAIQILESEHRRRTRESLW